MRKYIYFLIAGFFAGLLYSSYSFAALGDHSNSIAIEAQVFSGSRKIRNSGNHNVHEISTNNGSIKEYVNADGVVFAVSWIGIIDPDLSVLLGSYFSEYDSARSALVQQKGRHPISITTSNIIVLKGGHMRSRFGKAYIPTLIPDGIRPEDL